MAARDPGLIHWEASQRLQERYESYLLSLTFTLLALAVQSASFGPIFWRNNVEILGWSALLVSGISGLSRAQWLPQLFGQFSRQSDAEDHARSLRNAKRKGAATISVEDEGPAYPITEWIKRAEADAVSIKTKANELEKKTQLRFRIQRAAFLIGLISLAVSRGWPALSSIAERLRSLL